MEFKQKNDITYLPEDIKIQLNQLDLSLIKAKALTEVGKETDFSDYEDNTVCSDYWDNVLGLLEHIDELRQQIVENFQELVEDLTTKVDYRKIG